MANKAVRTSLDSNQPIFRLHVGLSLTVTRLDQQTANLNKI